MAEPVWYYARGDVERGPFTLPQIKSLATASKLRPDDLVWKEGMENWTAAREITELFPPTGVTGDALVPSSTGLVTEARSTKVAFTNRSSRDGPHEAQLALLRVTRVLVMVGIAVILGTRGFESLGERRVARMTAASEMAALRKSAKADAEKLAAAESAFDHQVLGIARGVALYAGVLILLTGAFGLLALSDQQERWFGIGVVWVIILALLNTLA